MTPYQYVHNNPINLIDPTGMSAEGGGGGLWSKIINSAKSFLGISSNERPNAQYADDGSELLNEIVISVKRNTSSNKLTNDWKKIKENSGYNHFVNWFKNLSFDGGFYFYDDDGKAKGDQSLRKRVPGKGAEAVNVTGFVQAASFAKGGEGIKYDIEDVKTTISFFNNTMSGIGLGNSLPDAKVEINSDFTWDIFFSGHANIKYIKTTPGRSTNENIVVPASKIGRTIDSLNRVNTANRNNEERFGRSGRNN